MEFPDRTVVLASRATTWCGGAGVDHSWYAAEESVVLTVRWPSVPGYRVDEPEEQRLGAPPQSSPCPAPCDNAHERGQRSRNAEIVEV